MMPSMDKEYVINYYDVDNKKRALVTSIFNFLGDIAMEHEEVVCEATNYLYDRNMTWVLYKWDVNIRTYPTYREKVTIRTKANFIKRFYAHRTYEMIGESGRVIATGESIWFIIDMESRRPSRIPQELYELYGIDIKNKDAIENNKIASPVTAEYEKEFSVRYSDIDSNNHVNNVKYIGWAIESTPEDIVDNYAVNDVKVIYEKEIAYGEKLKVLTHIEDLDNKKLCTYRMVDEEGKQLNLIRIEWV